MKVLAIRKLIAEFKTLQAGGTAPSDLWEIAENFRKNWDLTVEEKALVNMFTDSLQSSQNRSWWKRDQYRPKEMMGLFFSEFPDYSRQAFIELLNESIEVEVRLDRFKFYSDQLLELHKRKNLRSTLNNHYQDTAVISLYLFLSNTKKYPLYRIEWFRSICLLTEARPLPEADDITRFYKIAMILKKIMAEDAELTRLYEEMTTGFRLNFCKPMETFIPLADFCAYCARKTSE